MKLRVVELLLVTTLPALFLAADGVPPLGISLATLLGGTLAAGAANAFNMIIESDIDQLMDRTSKRLCLCNRPNCPISLYILDLYQSFSNSANHWRNHLLCIWLYRRS